MSRRLMLRNASGGGGTLPPEYQQVEWISNESTDAYINTGIIIPFKSPTSIKVASIIAGNRTYGSVVCSIGLNDGSKKNAGFDFRGSVQARRGSDIYSSGSPSPVGVFVEAEAIYTTGDLTVKANFPNNKYEKTYQTNNNSFGEPLIVSYDAWNSRGIGKFYYIIVEQTEKTIVSLIPCYRKQDGKIGMFDLISGTFFKGNFTKGADVN